MLLSKKLMSMSTLFAIITCGLYSNVNTSSELPGQESGMLEYKQRCLREIIADPLKGGNPSYPLSRLIKTVSADDADYIPKDPDAGKIFEQNGIRYQLMHNGVKVIEHGYYGSWMTDLIRCLRGHHEPQEEKAFYEVLQWIPPRATMIELGAYWGYYSLWFATRVSNARNWLVEPDPTYLKLGMGNFALNGKRANFVNGYIQMHDDDHLTFSGAKKIHLDTFLKEHSIEHVNILHSDIQGAEFEMLQSCQDSLRDQKIDYLFISTHSPGIHLACKRVILGYGYLVLAEHDMDESCSVDGLIVARRPTIEGPTHISIRKYR